MMSSPDLIDNQNRQFTSLSQSKKSNQVIKSFLLRKQEYNQRKKSINVSRSYLYNIEDRLKEDRDKTFAEVCTNHKMRDFYDNTRMNIKN